MCGIAGLIHKGKTVNIGKELGNIIEAYQEVARRLGIAPEQSNITEVKSGKPRTINFRRK